ncbi:protein ABIL3-like isoform X1 [Lycium ferocissimum]|uniref:protein ABIL3-like isoform X1 n=1 Tax=Lycium ferocissimum TaxID=112874 RepID=UPI002814C3D4|nr:protein ABIL3-like isoform X1 [Lycium ferocissimum]XP_059276359.1 protein ABIL3-like isoform X1 [Lycium ferocissimum]
MGNEPPFSAANGPQEGSNYDEIFMQHSLQFSDSLKDLKNLRKQLYSAAEYFESSYGENEHKALVIETLKDYVSKALLSSVDHLGSVACKLNSFLDEKVDEFSTTKLRFSCMEQLQRHNLQCQNQDQEIRNTTCVLKMTCRKRPPKISWTDASPNPLNFSFTRVASTKEVGNRSVSPLKFGLNRSGSVNRSVSPLMRFGSAIRRSISPSTSNIRQRCPSEPRRAISMSINPERNSAKDMQNYARKSKNLLTAFLSRHGHGQGSRKAGIPSKYHDDR